MNASQPPPQPAQFESNLPQRHRAAGAWRIFFLASTVVGIITLTTLLFNILDGSFGYVAFENTIEPESMAIGGVPLEELSKEQLVKILQDNVSSGLSAVSSGISPS